VLAIGISQANGELIDGGVNRRVATRRGEFRVAFVRGFHPRLPSWRASGTGVKGVDRLDVGIGN